MKRSAIREHLYETVASALRWGAKKLRGNEQPFRQEANRRSLDSSQAFDTPLLVVPGEASWNDSFGLLSHRLFRDQKPVYLAATPARKQDFAGSDRQLAFAGEWRSRRALYRDLSSLLLQDPPPYVFCVPQSDRELQVSIAAADISGAPLVLFMVSDLKPSSQLEPALREAIEKSQLFLAGSESLRAEYQKKYGKKVTLLPPVVPELQLRRRTRSDGSLRGVLLGVPEDPHINRQLQATLSQSETRITWVAAPREVESIRASLRASKNITVAADLPEELFQESLADADFVLAFDMTQEHKADNYLDIRVLSNLLCTICWARLPVLSVGKKSGAIARLVDAWGLGGCFEFSQEGLRGEIDKLVAPHRQEAIAQQATKFNPIFSAPFAAKLLRGWIDQGFVDKNPFDKFFEPIQDKLTPFVDAEAPRDIHWEFRPHYDALMRLKRTGYRPDFIVDLGASTGYWSLVAQRVFEEAHFFLVDPLIEKYREEEGAIYRLHPEFNRIAAAVGASAGETVFHVSQDLYGSSIFNLSAFPDDRRFTSLKVPIRTLDEIAETEKIEGRGILKIDVQFSEHLVLVGASEFLHQVDFVVIELSLKRFTPEVRVLDEFVDIFKSRGFRYYDFAGNWRDPATGELLQHDIIFGRDRD